MAAKGHIAVVCPTRDHKLALTCDNAKTAGETQGDTAWDKEAKEVPTNEVLEGSKLPLCVIKKVLTRQKKDEENQGSRLRNNIFHTQVEHQGKALDLIIDNRSGMNMIPQYIVNKLKLPVEKHLSPYKLNWVNDTSISVKHQCLITFSLGKNCGDLAMRCHTHECMSLTTRASLVI